MAEELRESHVLYQAICRLYAGVLDDKVGELDYLKPIRKVVDTAVVQGLGRTLTPDFYRGRDSKSLVRTKKVKWRIGYVLLIKE